MGIEVREMTIPREMLYLADEVLFCGTAVEITPVRSVDRVPVGSGKPGPVTRALQAEFMSIAKGRIADRHGWLTAVPVAAAVR
jgi:branched-chain amino acid aminotransferase